MTLPILYVHLNDVRISEQLNSCQSISSFSLWESHGSQHWIDQLEESNANVAIVDVNQFTKEDFDRLNLINGLSDIDLILVSKGHPNEYIDKLMQCGTVFHYREPIDFDVLDETLEEIANLLQVGVKTGQSVSTSDLDQFGLLVGSSPVMHRLYRTLRRVARTNANVFVVGESGSGKELVANTLHLVSDRKDGPFVAINCGAISPELVDSELFGHEKGSFTGAHKAHAGVFKQAEGGTLFLDEVTEMSLEHQVKLLRVLETGEYRPVGSQTDRIADVRIVAATNRDPQEAVSQDLFREDLFFRLAQFPVNVPPLRERNDDIVGLAKHFLAYRNANEVVSKQITPDALEKIASHDWPGNVRELKHTIERAYILADSVIASEHLVFDAPPLQSPSSLEQAIPAGVALEELEKVAIINTLKENEGNKTDTAQELGISVKTLYNKLEKYSEK